MKALIKQKPASQKEVFYQSDWLPWMDSETGAPLNSEPYGYGLCNDAQSDDPDDYIVERVEGEDEYGDPVVRLVAVMRDGPSDGGEQGDII